MVFKVKKRFIAGAVCPRCSEMDKLVTYKDGEKEFRECVSCGFKDEMRFKQQQAELETRVNMTEVMKKTDVQVLRLDANGNSGKS
jgi:uncharacterized metal-binding protein (TIGR02443 family)